MQLRDCLREDRIQKQEGREGIFACEVFAEVSVALAGIGVITILTLILGTLSGGASAAAAGGSFLVLWIAIFVYRAYLTNRRWIVAVTAEGVLLRLFRSVSVSRTGEHGHNQRSVLKLRCDEVESIAAGEVKIIWSSIRHQLVKYLFIMPTDAVLQDGELEAALASFHGYRCLDDVQRLAMFRERSVLVRWAGCRPVLAAFLQNVSSSGAKIVVSPQRVITVDLRNLVVMPEGERNDLLLFLRTMGFSEACVVTLSMRLRMSRHEAAKLMDSL